MPGSGSRVCRSEPSDRKQAAGGEPALQCGRSAAEAGVRFTS
jgi:hypothetical protein